MSSAAYRRARKLLNSDSTLGLAARILSIIEALLVLALVGLAGLLLALIVTRGYVQVQQRDFRSVPDWLTPALPAQHKNDPTIIPRPIYDTGLYPLVANNQTPESPWVHRQFARVIRGLLQACKPLRSNLSALAVLLATALGLLLAISLLRQLRRDVIARAGQRVVTSLRHQIHRQMYRLGQSSLPNQGTGPVVNLFTRDVNEIRDGLAADLDRTWRLPTLIIGLVLIALMISVSLTFFLIALGALVLLIARPMDRRARRDADAAVRDSAVQLALLHEDLAMLRIVRVYGMEEVDKRRFEEHAEGYNAADARRLKTEGSRNPTSLLLFGAAAVVAAGLLGYAVLEGRGERISPAAAFILLVSLLAAVRPLLDLLSLRRLTRQAGRSAQAVFDYLEKRPELQQAVGAQFLGTLKDRISFENVTLEDPSGRPLLVGVSVEIPAQSRTAILSLEEDSKHAIACLIPRLIDPTIGRVRMDGIDLRDATLESVRLQVATILQHDLVFSDSVLTNIGLGDPNLGLPRIIEAAKLAHAHHFIQDLPDGYDTLIGPLGHYLSPDQQYRIALARAFLHDPSVLIIEEPILPMDDDTKHLVDDTIDRLAPGRTLIFLPHRLSTIRKCDQVIVLHNGRVEAAGSPREVHNVSKLYRHIQYVEFNQFASGEVEAGQMG